MNASPLLVRDAMIRSYTANYARAQIAMSPRQIEAQVIADCQLVDAARTAGDLGGAGTAAPRAPEPPARDRPDLLALAADENGVRLVPDGLTVRSRRMHDDPRRVSERWGCAAARIARILEGVPRDKASLVVAVESAELGVLATEYAEAWANFMLREAPAPTTGNDRNPFRGLSTRDAARMFQRHVEDICDRSTGKLGPWYVK